MGNVNSGPDVEADGGGAELAYKIGLVGLPTDAARGCRGAVEAGVNELLRPCTPC